MYRDPYRVIHKAIRKRLVEVGLALGATDVRSAEELGAFRQQLRGLFGFLAHHAEHEERVIHPRLGAVPPPELAPIEAEHRELEQAIAALRAAADEVTPASAHALYLQYWAFVARYLEHVHREETTWLAALRATLTDDDFVALARADYGAETPEGLAPMLQRMRPAFNPDDLAQLYAEIELVMPPEAFARLRELTGWGGPS